MEMRRMVTLSLLASLAAACASAPKPAPAAVAVDLGQLAGEWIGEYYNSTTGREGALVLRLTAGLEMAEGQIWMVERPPHTLPPGREPDISSALPIEIRFTRGFRDSITGTLAAYADPATGYPLMTTLQGRLTGDRFHGTFVSDNAVTGDWTAGSWTAQRRTAVVRFWGPPVTSAADFR